MTNNTLEKPNDWWQLHLPLIISLISTHIPVTYLRYDILPYSSHTTPKEEECKRRRNGWLSSREVSTILRRFEVTDLSCVLCGEEVDITCHIFLKCTIARAILTLYLFGI